MPRPDRDQVHRAEAERLKLLPRADQVAVVDMYRQLADNPLATPACRADAKAKAAALERLLNPQRRRKKS